MQPHFMGATELAALIANGRLSAVEALQMFLERVERHNPALNAIVVLDADAAMERAHKADVARAVGRSWGPLHGVPMTVKDSFDLESHPSTFGRIERHNHRAARDALVVERLKAAGAIVFGKTNVPKDLADWQSFNEVYGTTVNPWDHARTPGGSSGGAAAALAAGLTGLELGSDIGGSIRIPAHFCGVYGHKPTYGIVPMRGHAMTPDAAPSDILVAGPLARRAGDLALALDLIAGADPATDCGWRLALPEEPRRRLPEFRIGVIDSDDAYPVDADTRAALAATAASLAREGATVVHAPALPLPSSELWRLYVMLLRGATSSRLSDEQAEAMRRRAAETDSNDRRYGAVMARGLSQNHRDWLEENDVRAKLRRLWREFFADVDALIAPMAPTAAFLHVHDVPKEDQVLVVDGRSRPASDTYFWIGLAATAYLPATVVPAGVSADGLPIGIQIIGPEYHDRRCLALAQLLEQAHRGFAPPPGYP